MQKIDKKLIWIQSIFYRGVLFWTKKEPGMWKNENTEQNNQKKNSSPYSYYDVSTTTRQINQCVSFELENIWRTQITKSEDITKRSSRGVWVDGVVKVEERVLSSVQMSLTLNNLKHAVYYNILLSKRMYSHIDFKKIMVFKSNGYLWIIWW